MEEDGRVVAGARQCAVRGVSDGGSALYSVGNEALRVSVRVPYWTSEHGPN